MMEAKWVVAATLVIAGPGVQASVQGGLASFGPEDVGCIGLAPVETTCEGGAEFMRGDHTRIKFLHPACAPPAVSDPCYVGDVQLVIHHQPGGHRVFTCSFLAVPTVDFGDLESFCTHSGPACLFCIGTLTCHSRVYATADGESPGSGVPGGAGRWGCLIDQRPYEP
jgi:hypothetical protein